MTRRGATALPARRPAGYCQPRESVVYFLGVARTAISPKKGKRPPAGRPKVEVTCAAKTILSSLRVMLANLAPQHPLQQREDDGEYEESSSWVVRHRRLRANR